MSTKSIKNNRSNLQENSMKTLFMIGGTMGVGKTTVGKLLKEELNNSVFLDGDWCWDASPFQVTDETKTMVLDNICYLLNNFLHCSAYDNIIFCWVMHQQSIIDALLQKLDLKDCKVIVISLICDEHTLKKRLEKDILAGIRTEHVIQRSIQRLPLYHSLHSVKIDTAEKNPIAIVREILCIP